MTVTKPSCSSRAVKKVLLLLLLAAAATSAQAASGSPDDAVFTSGTVPTDTGGQPVSAHEGWLMTIEDSYLWYGTSPKTNVSDGTTWDWLSDSILLYTSHDLSSWKRRATVFTAGAVPGSVKRRLLGASNGPLRLERPKVLYNAARRYHVLLLSLSNLDRSRSEVAWAVSVSSYGPFKFDGSRAPDGLPSWDITVATDGDSDAWLARTVPGTGVVISKLNGDFLDSMGRCASIPAAQPSLQQQKQQQPRQRQQQQQRQQWQQWQERDSPLHWEQQQPAQQGTSSSRRGRTEATAGDTISQRQQALLGQIGHLAGAAGAVVAASLKSGVHVAARAALQAAAAQRQFRFGGPKQQAAIAATGAAAAAGKAAGLAAAEAEAAAGAAVLAGKKAGDAGAPSLFKFEGRWYLMVAQHAGRSPTKALLYVNDGSGPCDEASWRQLPSPAQGPGAAHTFDSTPAFVYAYQFPGTDKVLLVYFGDRWHPQDPQGPPAASYVWLPLVPQAGGEPGALQLVNSDSWRLGDFRPPAQQLLQQS